MLTFQSNCTISTRSKITKRIQIKLVKRDKQTKETLKQKNKESQLTIFRFKLLKFLV